MAKSVASADRSKTRRASSNERNTWPSFVISRTRDGISADTTWYANCCGNKVSYPFRYLEFAHPLRAEDYATKWMCEECARKHGLLW